MKRTFFLLPALALLLPLAARAVPVAREIPFSRKVNLAVPGRYSFEFRLWTSADPGDESGVMVWSEPETILLKSRTLRHDLGSVTPFSNEGTTLPPVDFGRQLWVEVARRKGASYVALAGRTRLAAAPYALWSDSAPAGSITSVEIADGTITAPDLAAGSALGEIADDDGEGSTLDADLLDGRHGAHYLALIAQLQARNEQLQRELAGSRVGGGNWSSPLAIETDAAVVSAPDVAADPQGNAVVVWEQGTRIYANRFVAGAGWGTPRPLDSGAGAASAPQVAMDASGVAVAVWTQNDGSRGDIWASRFTPATGWGTPQLIETDAAKPCESPRVAMDPAGNAMAVWVQEVDEGGIVSHHIWANRYTAEAGWGAPQLLETQAGESDAPRVAMDASGNAMAAWHQLTGGALHIMANRYLPGHGWQGRQEVETGDGDSQNVSIAMDAAGNAMVVWQGGVEGAFSIFSSLFTPATGWGPAQPIETGDGNAQMPRVAMSASGNAVAAWTQTSGPIKSIWANCYTVGDGWGAARLVEPDDSGNAFSPHVAMDPSGNAVVVWYQFYGGADSIVTNRYVAGTGWAGVQLLEFDNVNYARYPDVAMDPNGKAFAVWVQLDGATPSLKSAVLR